MPVTNYTTVNGRVVSQNKAGVYSQLLRDPLGNVIATANSAGTKTNDTTYWPYGEVRTGGVGVITNFGFCGTWGYYTDSSGRQYVRARYYRPTLGRWQTVDPLWPGENAFTYCANTPTGSTDPTGLWVSYDKRLSKAEKSYLDDLFRELLTRVSGPVGTDFENCLENQCPQPDPLQNPLDLNSIFDLINKTLTSRNVVIQLAYNCKEGDCGFTTRGGGLDGTWYVHLCMRGGKLKLDPTCEPAYCALLHELIHALGVTGKGEKGALNIDIRKCVNLVPGCEHYNGKCT